MNYITSKTKAAKVHEWMDEDNKEKKAFFAFLGKLFNSERSTARISLTFTLAVCAFKAET